MDFQQHTGQRARVGRGQYGVLVGAQPTPQGWTLFLKHGDDVVMQQVAAGREDTVELLAEDGRADSNRVLAGLWTHWMRVSTLGDKATVLATSPLEPYAHQNNAVYGAMLPQPRLRFLPADEPGTGKTVMAGMYLRESQRLEVVNRALVVCPAHLVTKWQADFQRFFGGGLKRITNATAVAVAEGSAESPDAIQARIRGAS